MNHLSKSTSSYKSNAAKPTALYTEREYLKCFLMNEKVCNHKWKELLTIKQLFYNNKKADKIDFWTLFL